MSVAAQLGLADPDDLLLRQARQRWLSWVEGDPVLGVVEDLLDLAAWWRDADPADSDEVLLALARLASPAGADDIPAAGALAWVLLPGATLIAHRLRALTDRIDEVVAAQLWVEARSFGCEPGRRKVAANILMNTRKGVLRELGWGIHLRKVDPTWYRTQLLDPASPEWGEIELASRVEHATARQELADALDDAVEAGAISGLDGELLLSLVEAIDRMGGTLAGRGWAGLMAPAASEAVAERWGTSARTVRRRAHRSLQVLSNRYGRPRGISA